MTTSEQPAFDAATAEFEDYYGTVRGYIRERITRLNLLENLQGYGDEPLLVLDVDGGSGRDAAWLGELGHHVRLIEPAAKQAALARQRVAQDFLDEYVTVEQADPESAEVPDAAYDLVLSHGVLMYMPNPAHHLQFLHDKVRPGGVISILTKGKHGSLDRLSREEKFEAAAQLQETGRMVNNLGFDVLAVDEATMRPMLGEASLRLIEWYGVRVFTDEDHRRISDVSPAEREALLVKELVASSDPQQKSHGQMLQFICEREDT